MPELVAPIVPNAQENKSPMILLEGLRTGLAAFAQFAQIRRQQESDIAKLAFAERQAQEQHSLDQQKIDLATDMLPYQQKLQEAQTDLTRERAAAFTEGTATAAQMKGEQLRQKNLLLKEVSDNARELKLDDAHFQTKSPMEFAKNVMEFQKMYHLSPLPEVRKAIKDYQSIADSQKLFIRHGEEDDAGTLKGVGNGRNVPAWRIVSNVQNPATREQTLRDLEASGYTELVQGFQQFTDKEGKNVQVPSKTRVLRQPVRGMVEERAAMPDAASPAAPVSEAAPVATPQPDYGPDAETPQYPIGTRGKRGGSWYVLTDEGWKPE